MGMLVVLLGLVAAAIVTDFVAENGLTTRPDQSFKLFGNSFRLPGPELVLAAALMGALAIIFLILGIGLLRGSWGRRRGLKRRIKDLERENLELRSRAHLAGILGTEPQPEAPENTSDDNR